MKKSFYQLSILIILIGTIFIGGRYLLSQRESGSLEDPGPEETPIPQLLPDQVSSPTSTPILPPLQSSQSGDVYYFLGDWESAIISYEATLANASSPEEGSGALLGLGKVFYQKGEYERTLDYLRLLVASYPESAIIHKAYFSLAETFTALDRHLEAADAYQLYLDRRPGIIDSFIHTRRGDALSAAGESLKAIEAYQAAIGSGSKADLDTLQLKIGEEYAALKDYNTAIVIYNDVYTRSTNDYAKARSDYLIGTGLP